MPKSLALFHIPLLPTGMGKVVPTHGLTICVYNVMIRPHYVLKLTQENKDFTKARLNQNYQRFLGKDC